MPGKAAPNSALLPSVCQRPRRVRSPLPFGPRMLPGIVSCHAGPHVLAPQYLEYLEIDRPVLGLDETATLRWRSTAVGATYELAVQSGWGRDGSWPTGRDARGGTTDVHHGQGPATWGKSALVTGERHCRRRGLDLARVDRAGNPGDHPGLACWWVCLVGHKRSRCSRSVRQRFMSLLTAPCQRWIPPVVQPRSASSAARCCTISVSCLWQPRGATPGKLRDPSTGTDH